MARGGIQVCPVRCTGLARIFDYLHHIGIFPVITDRAGAVDNIEKIVIGIAIFIVTSVVAYLFRMRQLYAVTPKLYRHAPVSQNGSLCELIVFNKGNQVEEDIKVSLDPDIKAELLAASSTGIAFSDSMLNIERLHKGCEASVMLLVENGLLDSSKIMSVSSKGTKGRVCKKVSEVPPNFALYFLFLVLVIGIFPGMYYGSKAYTAINSAYVQYKLQSPHKLGWTNLVSYYDSEMRKSYGNQEFPIRFVSRQTDKTKKPTLTFDVFNKTAVPMTVYADRKGERKVLSPNFASVDISPMSQKPLTLSPPDPTDDGVQPDIEFSFKNGEEFIRGITFDVSITQQKKYP